jgi:hypothetical protein
METSARTIAIGVFENHLQAQRAVLDLKRLGFSDADIGVAGRHSEDPASAPVSFEENHASEGAMTGVAAGAGLGALWGVGIAAGLLPAVGPVIAGGTLIAILASAATGAAAAGIVGALIGMGIPEEEAHYYENEFHTGRTLVTVHAGNRYHEAMAVLQTHGGYDRSSRLAEQHSTVQVPVEREALGTGTARTAYTGGEGLAVPIREDQFRDVGEVPDAVARDPKVD